MAKSVHQVAHPYGPAVSRLIEQFASLPGVGRKSAERLAYHIISCPKREALDLANAIAHVKEQIRPCKRCFNLTDRDLCDICCDSRRQQDLVCVVEQPKDVLALEGATIFNGTYHVLQGRISPLEGIGPENLTINALIRRIREQGVREVVMATNPTVEGDGTALFISNLLEPEQVKVTRLARGIASGSVLEFANKEMLADALRGRQDFSL